MKDDLTARIAYLYYIENKTQAEIAKEMGIYRTSISRILKHARNSGIVKIEIDDFDSEIMDLEQALKKRFHLKYVQIAKLPPNSKNNEKDSALSKTAAKFIRKVIKSGSTVGLSWGSTIGGMISELDSKKLQNTLFVPLVGGPGHIKTQYHVNTLVYEMSKKFNGNSLFINSSVIEEDIRTRDSIIQSKYFERIQTAWSQIDIAIVSVGGGINEKSQWRDLLDAKDIEDLKLRETIGDCCGRFFDRDGKLIKNAVDNRTIGLSLENLAKVPISIAIVGSKKKISAIFPMLEKQYINSLITDEEIAKELLKK